jgi:FAD-dependent fumarate reductase
MLRRRILTLISLSVFIALASFLWRGLISTTIPTTSKLSTMTREKQSVIVVGSGLAGLSAASTLVSHSIPVILLERSAKPGGNSIKASSGINGAPTKYQPGPPFSDTSFYADSIHSAGKLFEAAGKEERGRRERLVGTLTNRSASAVEWLVGKGVDLSVVAQLGGHSFPRTHRGGGKTPPGFAIVSTLLNELKSSPLFTLQTGCVVTKVLQASERVEGVQYQCDNGEGKELRGPVVFATGGFAGDAHGMLKTFRPDLAGFPSTNEPRQGSQGLLTAVGAQLLDMEQVQVHPTSFVDPKDASNPVKFLAAELLRGEGGLLLTAGGKRFMNEMETRKNITDAIMRLPVKQGLPKQWDVQIVLDEGVYKHASSHIDFYVFKGLMKKTTLSELGMEAWKTVRKYALAAEGEAEDEFGRTFFGHWELKSEEMSGKSVMFVGRVTPAVHFTMGGVVINEHAGVLGKKGLTMEGIWAAGEVTGGIHGENRLGGSSLLECVVFGRIAGEEVARYVSQEGRQ